MAAWVLQLSDRYLLTISIISPDGSYSVAYVLGGVLSPWSSRRGAWPGFPLCMLLLKERIGSHLHAGVPLVEQCFTLAAFALSLLSTLVLETLFPLPIKLLHSYSSDYPIYITQWCLV